MSQAQYQSGDEAAPGDRVRFEQLCYDERKCRWQSVRREGIVMRISTTPEGAVSAYAGVVTAYVGYLESDGWHEMGVDVRFLRVCYSVVPLARCELCKG